MSSTSSIASSRCSRPFNCIRRSVAMAAKVRSISWASFSGDRPARVAASSCARQSARNWAMAATCASAAGVAGAALATGSGAAGGGGGLGATSSTRRRPKPETVALTTGA